MFLWPITCTFLVQCGRNQVLMPPEMSLESRAVWAQWLGVAAMEGSPADHTPRARGGISLRSSASIGKLLKLKILFHQTFSFFLSDRDPFNKHFQQIKQLIHNQRCKDQPWLNQGRFLGFFYLVLWTAQWEIIFVKWAVWKKDRKNITQMLPQSTSV